MNSISSAAVAMGASFSRRSFLLDSLTASVADMILFFFVFFILRYLVQARKARSGAFLAPVAADLSPLLGKTPSQPWGVLKTIETAM